ncbi:MAG: glucose 1-dehydrogenase [Myxococcales bacterium]|nr:glucose 1-dehydrogenase [Myxococcales bacterium]
MRAVAVFPSEKSIRVVDHPEPTRERDTDVLLQMLDVGVCGTDREIARFDYGTPPAGSPYLVIGHESLGQVLEVGPSVTRVAPGDLVVTMVRRPCGHPECRSCAVGRQDFCFTGDFTERGINGRHGFMTERVVDDERYMHVVPGRLREVGVLVEPLTIAEKALIQVWDVQERLPWTIPGQTDGDGHGQRAVVLGAGPVGLLGALALLVRGFETFVYSLEDLGSPKAQWVESVGGHFVSAKSTDLEGLRSRVGNIDLVYEATGAVAVSFRALAVLGTNGVFVFTGVPGRKGPIELEADDLMRNMVLSNQLVFGTVNAGPDAFAAAVADLATFFDRWPTEVAALITGRFSPDAAEELLLGPSSGIKRVVSFAGRP